MNQLMLSSWLAEEPVNTGPDFGKASPVGLVIVVLLLIAVLLLGWSMNRQLKKVPESFDDPDTGTGSTESAESADGVTATGTESPTGESSG